MRKILLALAFVGTVYGANWALTRYGTVPVWPGVVAPAGVYFAGIAFLLRDLLHEEAGRAWVLAAIAAGAVLSYLLGAGATIPGGHVSIAIASAVAFGISELADLSVYQPLRERSKAAAVGASQVAGAIVDSILFLWLAFGAVEAGLLKGQLIGKILLVVPVVVLLELRERRRPAMA